ERSARFLSAGDHLTVSVRVTPRRRDELLATALAVRTETPAPAPDGRLSLTLTFQDARHAEWALWQLGPDAEALTPTTLRTALRRRAAEMAERYGGGPA
ncbi:MAG: WYL domain-containing protein, partial [Streptomyces sp.]|nr:WYL domain-containing protein [Streptomyces sp.]